MQLAITLPTVTMEEAARHRQQVWVALHDAGLIQSLAQSASAGQALSPEERLALAQQIPSGQLLSEIIIAEREER